MWTRSLLKKNAWENVKGYYWPALGVSVLCAFLTGGSGGFGGGSSSLSNLGNSGSSSGSGSSGDIDPALIAVIVGIIIGAMVIGLTIGLAWTAFVAMPIKVGECKYFVTARNGDQSFAHVFDNFKGGNYMPTVKAMFFYYIEIYLWSLLFIIPGVIKAYEFALVPYLIAENPKMDIKRAKEISKQTMNGEKFNFWVLQLSFIGWVLLGCLACGIGVYFVLPYQNATYAEFYMCMRAKMLSFGYTTEDELTGGFYNGMGGSDPTNPGSSSQYNEPDFRTNAYNVPNDPYQSAQGGYQNPNDQYNGNMPGVDLDKPATPPVDLDKHNDSNDFNNPYNQ